MAAPQGAPQRYERTGHALAHRRRRAEFNAMGWRRGMMIVMDMGGGEGNWEKVAMERRSVLGRVAMVKGERRWGGGRRWWWWWWSRPCG